MSGSSTIWKKFELTTFTESGNWRFPLATVINTSGVVTFIEHVRAGLRPSRRKRPLVSTTARPADFWVGLVLGRGWDGGDVNAPGGPLGWAPLLYATQSCFASVELVRSLLARGADPVASFENEYGSMSALYGAAGVVHSAEITRPM